MCINVRYFEFERRPPSGFTLVELLVTLTVLALFFVMLTGAVQLGSRTWEVERARSAAIGDMEAVHSFVRRVLAQVQPAVTPDSPESSPAQALIGAPDAVGFIAPMPFHLSTTDVAAISLRIDKRGRTSRLIASWTPWISHALAPDITQSRATVLVDNVREISFSYFGPVEEVGGVPAWNDEWRSTLNVPWLVRMRLVKDDGAKWPDLIVTLRHADVPWHVDERAISIGAASRSD
ncbi:MAG TPA: prepilin-type N-terminal cleavage/methylation domain-containing protein [Alphaproteobacteria bacterium]|nr:prepilin-type N-terminal cleavage/methylation domain-containing protein [Alphaproteobacteria bacterium]